MLIVATFSRHDAALDWAQERLAAMFGPIEAVSPDFNFDQTTYYERTMGPGLKKRFLAFRQLRPFEELPDIKNAAIALEAELAGADRFPEPRPLNLDPGFLQLGKFLLATTKDQGHRIYLRDGIFAEVTLRFTEGKFELWPWTYRDYQATEVREFLAEVRERYKSRLAATR